MSRCFPFPPPGYVLNGIRIRDEAMIDSIKGVELEKVKKEKKRDKKDKKERKEKKKEKKEKKRKERENGDGESEKHSHKRRRKEEGVKDVRELEEKTTCLDRSSLTVERELLQSSSQNSCDSTLNSNEKEKPKEQPPLVDGRHNNSNDSESIIRIRLPIRRQKDPEVMLMANKDTQIPREVKLDTTSQRATTSEQQQQQQQLVNQHPCSTSAPEHASKPQQPVNQHPCSTSAPQHASKPPHEEKRKDHISTTKLSKETTSTTKHSKEKKTSTTKHSKEKISSSLSWTPEPYQPSRLCSICPPSLAAQFLNVVENWVPTTTEKRVELANSGDEECWWVMKKPSSHKFDTERCKQLNINNEIQQVTAWPCARLLPEADVHALPYTVPF